MKNAEATDAPTTYKM
jgi:photosystem II stability/assembly factor-like uncharacterized protein